MEVLIVHFYRTSCHFMPFRPVYSPRHPALKHPCCVLQSVRASELHTHTKLLLLLLLLLLPLLL
jgi:hypothetical protein